MKVAESGVSGECVSKRLEEMSDDRGDRIYPPSDVPRLLWDIKIAQLCRARGWAFRAAEAGQRAAHWNWQGRPVLREPSLGGLNVEGSARR